ncbi:MAG: hypothetical protein KME28_04210 [Pelatocladus maniniholoensis HA4357-MV3]|uniref:Uncharacterized protein n=1 Tax=Pelatocladus maniniholoensis HA4357-MV3 TaxID=1117104 RepID=A0A9E3H4S7_9NOST|nr:hypothetical protein [Pelatocladus maniniholoensis HA4357-MV3]MBW4430946.1 hypothetical protein [Pelatocladus maniniholoensis HA4357-MV3]
MSLLKRKTVVSVTCFANKPSQFFACWSDLFAAKVSDRPITPTASSAPPLQHRTTGDSVRRENKPCRPMTDSVQIVS